MNLKYRQQGSWAIVYDADSIPHPEPELFAPEQWRSRGAVVGEASGRGRALLLETAFGPAVLRTFRRGGWAARFSDNSYLFTGFRRSRPFREAHMLAHLTALGLPVPRPLGGFCTRHGLICRGALLTRRIDNVTPLAERLTKAMPTDPVWAEIGRTVRRFHDAGFVHADLNARNILVENDGSVHLVDFDRAQTTSVDGRRQRASLERLKRSLVKHWPVNRRREIEACWLGILGGYESDLGGAE